MARQSENTAQSREAARSERPFPPIGELFYRTRALKGREWTLKRFAAALGIDPVFLGYIEKGQRFPNEELVGKLARIRGEDPRELLAVLYRDRMVHVLTREIRRAIGGADEAAESEAIEGADASMTPVLSHALAALPDSGEPMPLETWRRKIREALREHRGTARRAELGQVVDTLTGKGLAETTDTSVRKIARHIHAVAPEERAELAIEFSAIFAKSLTDKIVRGESDTYLVNHFLTIPSERVGELRRRIDSAVREIVEDMAQDEDADEFVRVLVAGTPRE